MASLECNKRRAMVSTAARQSGHHSPTDNRKPQPPAVNEKTKFQYLSSFCHAHTTQLPLHFANAFSAPTKTHFFCDHPTSGFLTRLHSHPPPPLTVGRVLHFNGNICMNDRLFCYFLTLCRMKMLLIYMPRTLCHSQPFKAELQLSP